MAELFQYPDLEKKKRNRHPWLLSLAALALLLLLTIVFALISVFKTADLLMTRPPREFNTIASHLMPAYDNVSFKSEKDQLILSGWYMHARGTARASIILVHQNGANRMQFALESAELFQYLRDEGFNLFLFDLRHSGKSEGDHASFGFAEYRDVLGAIERCRELSGSRDIILYGIGSGVTASLFAWDHLPESGEAAEDTNRGDIKAMIFDTPAASAYDYIRAELSDKGILNRFLYNRCIPAAVRMASGGPQQINLIPLASKYPGPMMLIRNLPDTRIPAKSLDAFNSERLRLNPETTYVSEVPKEGHLEAFIMDKEAYKADLKTFLDRWIRIPASKTP